VSRVESLRRWDPERIGPYAIIGRLGAGAMGQVFLGRSTAGRLVAVKTIRIDLAEEPGFRTRFAREVAAARQVSGVFTAAVVEADPEADLPWLATAYVPAPSLSRLVQACGPLPVAAVRWLAAGCAEALESIHAVGLLHRDLKPSNVLVAPDGPRVIDFGVARAAERVQLTVTRGAVGTPAYMAPEQARDTTQGSPASDVFSLGATLVFAATGHPPYQGETVMDVLVRLATEPPDLSGLPTGLSELIAPCLERVPRSRPTGTAILARLGSFAATSAGAVHEHAYLPEDAMALIAEYQHSPQLTGWTGDDDATSASHTALPEFATIGAELRTQDSPARGRWPLGGRRAPRLGNRGGRSGARRPLMRRAGQAAVAVALIAAGTALGMSLRSSPTQAAGNQAPAGPPPAGAPPSGGPPASCLVPVTTGTPQLCVNQPYGDGNTSYVIHGNGFAPGAPVTVSLAGVGTSRFRPVADQRGTFNYVIDQGHYFFPGQIPPGTYRVVAADSGGQRASVSFRVSQSQSQPPPG
jgi:serine/threonine protein kinase